MLHSASADLGALDALFAHTASAALSAASAATSTAAARAAGSAAVARIASAQLRRAAARASGESMDEPEGGGIDECMASYDCFNMILTQYMGDENTDKLMQLAAITDVAQCPYTKAEITSCFLVRCPAAAAWRGRSQRSPCPLCVNRTCLWAA